eukprot:Rmarinus@m.3919
MFCERVIPPSRRRKACFQHLYTELLFGRGFQQFSSARVVNVHQICGNSSASMSESQGSDSGDCGPTVLLGFLEEVENSKHLESRFFPSKAGGKPAWLDPARLPDTTSLTCSKCSKQMMFLVQIYSPGAGDDQFHRTIYVFCCKDEECLKVGGFGSVRALRAQLPKANPFYPATPPQDDDEILFTHDFTCVICGLPGLKRCGQCQKVRYCGRDHQKAHWASGHKTQCCADGAATSGAIPEETKVSSAHIFPEMEVVIDNEFDDDDDLEHESDLLKKYETDVKTGTALEIGEEDLKDLPGRKEDPCYDRFMASNRRNPEQCIRYSRWNDEAVLWVKSTEQIPSDRIPPCDRCGGKRAFEFQILPQILYKLHVENLPAISMDFGTIAVFSCVSSCNVPSTPPSQRELQTAIQESPTQGVPLNAPVPEADSKKILGAYVQEFAWLQPM